MHSSRMRTGRSLTVCRGGSPCPGRPPCQGGSPCQGGLLARGASLPGGLLARGVSLPGGVLLPGGCLLAGGVSLPGGPPCRGGSPCRRPPLVDRITDTRKNITLASTSLRPVIMGCTVKSGHIHTCYLVNFAWTENFNNGLCIHFSDCVNRNVYAIL